MQRFAQAAGPQFLASLAQTPVSLPPSLTGGFQTPSVTVAQVTGLAPDVTRLEQQAAQVPGVSGSAGRLTGALFGETPTIAAAAKGIGFGRAFQKGIPLLRRMGLSAIETGELGAATEALRGQPERIPGAAAGGAAAGLLLPPLGAALGRITRPVLRRFKRVGNLRQPPSAQPTPTALPVTAEIPTAPPGPLTTKSGFNLDPRQHPAEFLSSLDRAKLRQQVFRQTGKFPRPDIPDVELQRLTQPPRIGGVAGSTGTPQSPERVTAEAVIQTHPDLTVAARQARVDKMVQVLKAANPVRRSKEALMTEERGKRLARIMAIRQRVGGERGAQAELGALKGELPNVHFEAIRRQFSQSEIDALFNDINAASLGAWEPLTARSGLMKAFRGEVPTPGELELLRRVFGSAFPKALLEKRSLMQRLGSGTLEALNLPRAMMTSFDFSAPLRQGLFLIGRPKQWMPAFTGMFRHFASPDAFQAAEQQIRSRPTFELMRRSGLALTDMGENLLNREEAFMSRLGEKIPAIGAGVRASNRAFTGFLNKLRADVFDDLLKKGQQLGIAETPEFLPSLARYINAATGRGPLPGALEQAAPILNSIFFSPRLIASRLALLSPPFYVTLHPAVRQAALKDLLTMTSAGVSVLGLAKLNGASVGVDPRSADFGKIRIGNTRFDIWGGFQQPIRAAAQMLTGKMISSTTGRETVLGEGFRATTREDILLRFLQSKQAPVLSLLTTLLRGKTFTGEPPRLGVEVADRFIPMFLQDAFEVSREQGIDHAWMALPGAFGVGVQTYGTLEPVLETTATGRESLRFQGRPSLAETLINRATGRQTTNIPASLQEPLRQARQTELERKTAIDRAKRLTIEDGQERQVGNTTIFLDKGIVRTRTAGRVSTPELVLEGALGRRLRR